MTLYLLYMSLAYGRMCFLPKTSKNEFWKRKTTITVVSNLNLNKLATYLQHPEGWLNMASDQYKKKKC